MTITQTITTTVSQVPPAYLVDFICEIMYQPGKWRPEVFRFPRDTQPGHVEPNNGQLIRVIEKLINP
jgi:hypothetical protein